MFSSAKRWYSFAHWMGKRFVFNTEVRPAIIMLEDKVN